MKEEPYLQPQQHSTIDFVFYKDFSQVIHVNGLQVLIYHFLLTPFCKHTNRI